MSIVRQVISSSPKYWVFDERYSLEPTPGRGCQAGEEFEDSIRNSFPDHSAGEEFEGSIWKSSPGHGAGEEFEGSIRNFSPGHGAGEEFEGSIRNFSPAPLRLSYSSISSEMCNNSSQDEIIYNLFAWILAARTVFLSSMVMVMGPTPPGYGEIQPATSLASLKATSPARR